MALRDAGVHSIMINSNPETVSTDFDASDRALLRAARRGIGARRPARTRRAVTTADAPRVLVQFGGQTAINLAEPLVARRLCAARLGPPGDRHRRGPRPVRATCSSTSGFRSRRAASWPRPTKRSHIAEQLGYPVLVRPSYVLGGRAMEIVATPTSCAGFAAVGQGDLGKKPDPGRQVPRGREVEVDAICDGDDVLIPGHHGAHRARRRPLGRLHRGLPAQRSAPDLIDTLVRLHDRSGRALGVVGLFNIQYVISRATSTSSRSTRARAARSRS